MTRSFAQINLDHIAANTRVLRAAAPDAKLCAVVKADGYGHGEIAAARAVVQGGASYLAVARVEEGVRLREAGIEQPIWVLAEPLRSEFESVAKSELQPCVYSAVGIEAAGAAGAATETKLTVHLKVDTGMHRVGAAPADLLDLARRIESHKNLVLGSVWTHCAVADEPQNPFTEVQLHRFDAALQELKEAGIDVPLSHAANSAATIWHPRAHHDVVRCGIALYGLAPSPALHGVLNLKPALSWHSAVSFVKRLQPGDRVGYGLQTELTSAANAATVPVGYADGYARSLWRSRPMVLIGGKPRNILGVITMDQLVVDCGDDAVSVGDEVVLIGRQGEVETTASDLATALGTINYEVVCGISRRVERRYEGLAS